VYVRGERTGPCGHVCKSVWCMLGVNVPDHAAMFASLRKLLVKRVTPHVVSLHSNQCQALKSAVLNIATQLVPTLSSQVSIYFSSLPPPSEIRHESAGWL